MNQNNLKGDSELFKKLRKIRKERDYICANWAPSILLSVVKIVWILHTVNIPFNKFTSSLFRIMIGKPF